MMISLITPESEISGNLVTIVFFVIMLTLLLLFRKIYDKKNKY